MNIFIMCFVVRFGVLLRGGGGGGVSDTHMFCPCHAYVVQVGVGKLRTTLASPISIIKISLTGRTCVAMNRWSASESYCFLKFSLIFVTLQYFVFLKRCVLNCNFSESYCVKQNCLILMIFSERASVECNDLL